MHDLILAAKVCHGYGDIYQRAFMMAMCSHPDARLVHCDRAGEPYAFVTRAGSVVDPWDGQVYPERVYKKQFGIKLPRKSPKTLWQE